MTSVVKLSALVGLREANGTESATTSTPGSEQPRRLGVLLARRPGGKGSMKQDSVSDCDPSSPHQQGEASSQGAHRARFFKSDWESKACLNDLADKPSEDFFVAKSVDEYLDRLCTEDYGRCIPQFRDVDAGLAHCRASFGRSASDISETSEVQATTST
mmetsp:Transcript_60085/g.127291  ORF Transcript_60085/g.127291 Transcript_60085/m.127291 type:complete len:159 (-) Transcript_60085:140-616(-)|eukprot:CAMPEP_0206424872 /NCGR_PEP_ID=MMETSP0324_2-20121206/3473_1 /ASSEMBLY_ACC=CAM_ASM_000836 /TAXON_ID=2866 /ORGANISM="Crypthecodinium cohnii, Strain Seligo" /LENGTH=158 /DNA_ID=CAMNT_0053889583 /DNA_START=117 /DNA_END=593 /DNA_ORIENTATION=-